jgi:hypothetical protein
LSRVLQQLAPAEQGDVIAGRTISAAFRNVRVARAPAFTPLPIKQYAEDSGQELSSTDEYARSSDARRRRFLRPNPA